MQDNKGPLAGLKVLDFSQLLPGPYATMLLADMGAEVVRVEAPNRRDMVLDWPPFVEVNGKATSCAHLQLNRNKQSIELDLTQSESVSVIRGLLTQFDVVVEQFRPGVMAKFSLDYPSLKTDFPALIYCSISGYGQTGPLKEKAGHDINYLALSGISSYSGLPEAGPVLSGVQIADLAGGSHQAVMSVLAAVISRQQSGQGQYLDISMTDAAFSLNALFASGTILTGQSPEPGSTPLNGAHLYGYYQTKDGRHLAIGALEPRFVSQLIEALSLAVEDPARPEMKLLKQQLQHKIRQKTLDEWLSFFEGLDICVTPVLTLAEASQSELLTSRGMVSNHTIGQQSVSLIAPAAKLKGMTTDRTGIAPAPGEHTESLLEKFGISDAVIKHTLNHNLAIKTGEQQ